MYYPPFEATIKAGVGSGMCSYNKINHVYSCANNQTLNYHLRELMGFDGFIMSDWGAVYDEPKDYVTAGCDQEMGRLKYYTEEKLKAQVTDDQVFTAAYRIAKAYIKMGLYEKELPDNYVKNVSTPEHIKLAQKGVEESTVLLKNDWIEKEPVLPIKKDGKEKLNILIVGNASAYPVV